MFKYTLNLQGLSLYFDKTEKIDTNKDLKENNMSQKTMKTMDGNTAAAHVSYAFTEVRCNLSYHTFICYGRSYR